MNPFSLILNGGAFFLIAGVFLSSYSLLTGLVVMTVRIWNRLFVSWARRRLRDLGIVRINDPMAKPILDGRRMALFLIIPIVALAVRDYLISPLVVLFGVLIIVWIDFQTRQNERGRVNEDAEIAALQVRSLLQVDRSLLNALNGIELPDGALKRSLQQVISRLQMHQPPEQAAKALQGLAWNGHSAFVRFDCQQCPDHRRYPVFSSGGSGAGSTPSETAALQDAPDTGPGARHDPSVARRGGGCPGFVLLSPTWRVFFLQDIPHRTLLTVLMVCAVLASLYFEFEVYQLGSSEAF